MQRWPYLTISCCILNNILKCSCLGCYSENLTLFMQQKVQQDIAVTIFKACFLFFSFFLAFFFFLFSARLLFHNPSGGLHALNMLTGKLNRYILYKSPQTQKPQVAASLNRALSSSSPSSSSCTETIHASNVSTGIVLRRSLHFAALLHLRSKR